MIVAHVTLLAGTRIPGFFFGKSVSGMALVARVVLVTESLGHLFFFLLLGFDPHVVAATATATAFNQFVWSHVGGGNRVESCPSEVMLSGRKLVKLFLMTLGTDLFTRQFRLFTIFGRLVRVPMTGGTSDIVF